MKLGINSYTYMWAIGFEGAKPQIPLDSLGLLDKAHELGVRLVQTGPNLPMEDRSLRTFVNQAILNETALEFGIRGLELEKLIHWIQLCHQLNVRFLRTVPEIGGDAPSTGDMIDILRQLKPHLAENNIKLGLENGKLPCRELRKAIEAVDSPFIGIVLDMVNSLAVSEGWKEVSRELAPHTMCLHFKDFSIQRAWHMMGFICEGRPAGKGQLDADWLFRTLERSNHPFNVILELWTPQQKNLEETISLEQEWAETSIRYLRQYIPD